MQPTVWVFFLLPSKKCFAFLSASFPRNSRRIERILVSKVTPPDWLSFANLYAKCRMRNVWCQNLHPSNLYSIHLFFLLCSNISIDKSKNVFGISYKISFLPFGVFITFSGVNTLEVYSRGPFKYYVRIWQFLMVYSTVNHQRGGWV